MNNMNSPFESNNPFGVYDIHKLCAICQIKLESDETHSLFATIPTSGANMVNAFQVLGYISKFDCDNGPQMMCTTCLDKTKATYEFIQICNRAHNTIQDYLIKTQQKEIEPVTIIKHDDSEHLDLKSEPDMNVYLKYEPIEDEITMSETTIVETCTSLNTQQTHKEERPKARTKTEGREEQEPRECDSWTTKTDSDDSSTQYEVDVDHEHQNGEATTSPGQAVQVRPESKKRYDMAYAAFKSWCEKKQIADITENVLLHFFQEKSELIKSPSSLWSDYSMLKTTLLVNDNTNIAVYLKLRAFLKNKNVGYRPKTAKIFTNEDIHKFLQEAPDDVYLLMKVVMIMGISGACRKEELWNMTIDDIEDRRSTIVITIPGMRPEMHRSAVIVDAHYLKIFRKYVRLRPKTVTNRRFFVRYNSGKCVNQVVGKKTFNTMLVKIAKFLKLQDPTSYTGHSFRKTATSLTNNFGVKKLKRRAVAESFVLHSRPSQPPVTPPEGGKANCPFLFVSTNSFNK